MALFDKIATAVLKGQVYFRIQDRDVLEKVVAVDKKKRTVTVIRDYK